MRRRARYTGIRLGEWARGRPRPEDRTSKNNDFFDSTWAILDGRVRCRPRGHRQRRHRIATPGRAGGLVEPEQHLPVHPRRGHRLRPRRSPDGVLHRYREHQALSRRKYRPAPAASKQYGPTHRGVEGLERPLFKIGMMRTTVVAEDSALSRMAEARLRPRPAIPPPTGHPAGLHPTPGRGAHSSWSGGCFERKSGGPRCLHAPGRTHVATVDQMPPCNVR